MNEDLQNLNTPTQTAGALLRQAREATGLHIAALAVAMKVPVKKLEALEADRLDALHDAVFVRALAASMCRALKIDPAPVLSLLPKNSAPRFERDDRGINMPYSTPGMLSGNIFKGLFAKPAALLVAALLIGALVVMCYPESGVSERAAALLAPPNVALAATPSNPSSAPSVIAASAVIAGTGAAPAAPLSGSSAAALAIRPVPSASSSVAPVAQAVAASTPALASGPEAVAFKASASAWVRVSDSRGVVQFEKTLAAGESAVAGGALPLSVVLGNVAATEVTVRGQPFALQALTKDNVARFEVK